MKKKMWTIMAVSCFLSCLTVQAAIQKTPVELTGDCSLPCNQVNQIMRVLDSFYCELNSAYDFNDVDFICSGVTFRETSYDSETKIWQGEVTFAIVGKNRHREFIRVKDKGIILASFDSGTSIEIHVYTYPQWFFNMNMSGEKGSSSANAE